MQPDNARPAASSPRITFSDDMAYFQSKVLRSQQQSCGPNATIPLIPLSAKPALRPAFARPFRAAEARLWLLCRKFCDFRLISGQGIRPGRIVAAPVPPRCHKYGSAVNAPVMKHLPESGLVP